MTNQRGESACANLTTANVLMSIQFGAVRRLAVVVMDHHELLESDLAIKLFNDAIKFIKIRHLNTSAPKVRRV